VRGREGGVTLRSEGGGKGLEQYNAWVMLEKEDTCPHGLLHIARWVYVLYTKANWYHIPGDILFIFFLLHPPNSLFLPPAQLSYCPLSFSSVR